MHKEKELTAEEQLAQYHKLKTELLQTYHKQKEALEYAVDNVEEGLIKEKREKLARQIKALSAKIAELTTEESST